MALPRRVSAADSLISRRCHPLPWVPLSLGVVLRGIGVVIFGIGLLFVLLPSYTTLPSLMAPPVEVVWAQSGLWQASRGYFHRIAVRNKSDSAQDVVIAIKTKLDYSPQRIPISLGPREERTIETACSLQPNPNTSIELYIDIMRSPEIGVEYSGTPFGYHSVLTLLTHRLVVQILLMAIGGGLIAAGSARQHKRS